MSSRKLGIYIRELIKRRGIKVTDLSQRTTLSRECLYKLMRGDVKQPDLTTIVLLAKALNVHPIELLRRLFDGWGIKRTSHLPSNKKGDAVGFLGDITYPDNSVVCVNERFTKIWEIQNTGAVTWRNRRLVCLDGQIEVRWIPPGRETPSPPAPFRLLRPSQPEVLLPNTCPGESIQIGVEFTAPPFPCATFSYWKMVDESGNFCFPELEGLSCLVRVVAL